MTASDTAHPPDRVVTQLVASAARVPMLVARRRLHRHRACVGSTLRLPDGRRLTVFRETTCDEAGAGEPVTLVVRFHLKGLPARAWLRHWLFERASILITVVFAGFTGFRRKLWLADPATGDYAGLYEWVGAEAAERYARYITAVVRPLSTPGSVGYEIVGS